MMFRLTLVMLFIFSSTNSYALVTATIGETTIRIDGPAQKVNVKGHPGMTMESGPIPQCARGQDPSIPPAGIAPRGPNSIYCADPSKRVTPVMTVPDAYPGEHEFKAQFSSNMPGIHSAVDPDHPYKNGRERVIIGTNTKRYPKGMNFDNKKLLFTNVWHGHCFNRECSIGGGYLADNPMQGILLIRLPHISHGMMLIEAPTATGPLSVTYADEFHDRVFIQSLKGEYAIPEIDPVTNLPVKDPKFVNTQGGMKYTFGLTKGQFE